MFFKKTVISWKVLEPKIKKSLAGQHELFELAQGSLGTVSLKGTAVILMRILSGVVEVSVSMDCDPMTLAKVVAELSRHTKWILSHAVFIHADNGDILWGKDAQTYYATREILMNAVPGMVFLKEDLC